MAPLVQLDAAVQAMLHIFSQYIQHLAKATMDRRSPHAETISSTACGVGIVME